MASDTTAEGLDILGAAECRRLLAEAGVGCLALPGDGAAAPELRPVNFVLHGDALVVRTGESRILEAARRGDPVAFEIDGIDRVEHTGWSVIVTGKISEHAADQATRALPLRAWGSGAKDHFVSIPLESVSGRRIPAGRGNR